jgi:hypothetical protein
MEIKCLIFIDLTLLITNVENMSISVLKYKKIENNPNNFN